MKHTKRASIEGRDNLITIVVMMVISGFAVFYFELSVKWGIFLAALMLFLSVFMFRDIVAHLRSDKVFLCELTDDELIQECPVESRGDSFRISLSEIVKIELEHTNGNPRWFVHTIAERYHISASYQNIDRKIGDELLKRLPHAERFNS
jgi:cell division protein FtsW (lipid II flippase)